MTASVQDALRLGCSAICFTFYPGSDVAYDMMQEIAELRRAAKSYGLAVVVRAYPRGGNLSKAGETAVESEQFLGRVEHIVSGDMTHFHTLDELWAFMRWVLAAQASSPEEPL